MESVKVESDKPITLVYKDWRFHGQLETDAVMLDVEMSLYHMDRVKVLDSRTPELIGMIFDLDNEEVGRLDSDEIRRRGSGYRHMGGLMDLTLKLRDKSIKIDWAHPEALLHPKAQCNLGDVLIKLAMEIVDG